MQNELRKLIKRMQSRAERIAEKNNNEGYATLEETELYDVFDFIQIDIHSWARELEKIAETLERHFDAAVRQVIDEANQRN